MKELLRILYDKNIRFFNVWNHLYLYSDDNNEIVFTNSEIIGRFKIPHSTLTRAIQYALSINNGKTYIEMEKIAPKTYKVKFYPNGKRTLKSKIKNRELKEWIVNYYKKEDFDYPELKKHLRFVDSICGKLEQAIKDRATEEYTPELLIKTFYVFFEKIPDWWKENAFTLPSINKNFSKILNQIKLSANGKTNKYVSATKGVEDLDFEKITKARD
tara:strand:+ start:69 stop:713 length:645 start_codon:yes stop_codon:yes gene_type:complete